MKRLIASIVLFFFSLSLAIGSHVLLMKSCDKMIAMLNECIQVADSGDRQMTEEKSEQMSRWWEKKHMVFSVLVIHGELDTMQRYLPTLKEVAQMGDMEKYKQNCLECISMTMDLKLNEKINVGNIF